MSSSDNGESEIVVTSALPEPHDGCWANSSGLDVQSTNIGTSRASVTRWSRNSSMAGSAQCRSSMTIARGAVSATSSRNRVQAANDSERSAGASPGFEVPTNGARRLLSQPRSVGRGSSSSRVRSSASATERRSCPGPTPIRARTISSRAVNVMLSP